MKRAKCLGLWGYCKNCGCKAYESKTFVYRQCSGGCGKILSENVVFQHKNTEFMDW